MIRPILVSSKGVPMDAEVFKMIERRGFDGLGGADHGWLKAKHHFSFANYYDPKRMGWGPIRVWNDDEIAPNSGFPPHPHSDMEIITYVREGAITHQDSLGNKGRDRSRRCPGDRARARASAMRSTIWRATPPASSRSGSSQPARAARRPGAPSLSPRATARVAS